jgi:hypothetical protein
MIEAHHDNSSTVIPLYFNILFLQWFVHYIYFPLRCLTDRHKFNFLLLTQTTALFLWVHVLSLAALHALSSEWSQHKRIIRQWLLPAKFFDFYLYLFFLFSSASDKFWWLFPGTTGPDFLSIFILYLSTWQFELSNHMFVPLKNMLQHSKVSMNGFAIFCLLGWFLLLLCRVHCYQLRFIYFGVHYNILANNYT